jgi:hypothetical protein
MMALISYEGAELIGAASVFLLLAGIFLAAGLLGAWERYRGALFYRRSVDEEVIAAQLAIREVRRQAMRDLVEEERQYRGLGSDSPVIEGSCVEVERV